MLYNVILLSLLTLDSVNILNGVTTKNANTAFLFKISQNVGYLPEEKSQHNSSHEFSTSNLTHSTQQKKHSLACQN